MEDMSFQAEPGTTTENPGDIAEYAIRLPTGLRVVLRGRQSRMFDWFRNMFALCADACPDGGVPLDILAGEDDRTALPPDLRRQFEGLSGDHGAVVVYGRDHEIAVSFCEEGRRSCAWTDAGASHMGFRVSDPLCFVLQNVFTPVLKEVLLSRGALLMHSAAVSLPSGVGAMFVADGGGGKTTTALAVMLAGAKFLSDDLAAVQCDGDRPSVEGIPERMNLTKETIAFFPSLSSLYERFDELAKGCRNKTPLAPDEILHQGRMQDKSPLDVVYRITVAVDGPRVVQMSPTKALGLFVRAHTFAPAERMKPEAFARLTSLADRVRVYALTTGPDPNILAQWLIRHAHEHARG